MNGKSFVHSAIFGFCARCFFFLIIWTLSEKMKMEMYDAGAVKQIYADLKAQPEEKRKGVDREASGKESSCLYGE